jgi:hypothetical protein
MANFYHFLENSHLPKIQQATEHKNNNQPTQFKQFSEEQGGKE